MNDFKNMIKNVKNIFTLFLLLSTFLSIYFYLNPPVNKKSHPVFFDLLNSLFPNLTASALVALIGILIWGIVSNNEKKVEKNELLSDISDMVKGLRQGNVDDVFGKAASYIENCNEILVIGTAKQDEVNKFKGVRKYLSATIKRVQNRQKLQYKRITALNLNNTFKQHLADCLKKSGQHDIELIFLEDFSPAYTYLIIDNIFLMVSLTHNEENETTSKLCLYTEHEGNVIIEQFRKHFNAVWDTEESRKNRIVTNESEFDYVHGYQSKAAISLKKIKDEINGFPPNEKTLAQKHALSELKSLSEKFKYFNTTLKVEHMTDNENMISIFIDYLGFLRVGDQYRTITFCSFWENIIPTKNLLNNFVNANKRALKEKALIERLLVVDVKQLTEENNEKYVKNIRIIIDKNIEIMEEYNEYNFKILFSNEHTKFEEQHYNFAIITTKDETENIVFKPIRNHSKVIEATDIMFNTEPSRLVEYQEMFERLYADWSKQLLNNDIKMFLKTLNLNPRILFILTGQNLY